MFCCQHWSLQLLSSGWSQPFTPDPVLMRTTAFKFLWDSRVTLEHWRHLVTCNRPVYLSFTNVVLISASLTCWCPSELFFSSSSLLCHLSEILILNHQPQRLFHLLLHSTTERTALSFPSCCSPTKYYSTSPSSPKNLYPRLHADSCFYTCKKETLIICARNFVSNSRNISLHHLPADSSRTLTPLYIKHHLFT